VVLGLVSGSIDLNLWTKTESSDHNNYLRQDMGFSDLVLETAPPLDPDWLKYEEEANLRAPKKVHPSVLDRQPEYAQECRVLTAKMLASGARYADLATGIVTNNLEIASTVDGFMIPVLHYRLEEPIGRTQSQVQEDNGQNVVVYYHGGGLHVGEADSEDVSCRQLLRSGLKNLTVYSVGYRLMPTYPAATCVADSMDAFNHIRHANQGAKLYIVGSSSGGELAAFVSQFAAPESSLSGVLLRCPVTSDAFSGKDYLPPRLQTSHTSASEPFKTTLLGYMNREVPRDGLDRMPLEAATGDLRGLPRTWIQVCTNDVLYSDGVCYAMALEEAGVEVKVDVVQGWPHTFWLKAPQLERAAEADRAMVDALLWAAGP
jgi:acetyl esterase/lipase